jgi:hypothetical protein
MGTEKKASCKSIEAMKSKGRKISRTLSKVSILNGTFTICVLIRERSIIILSLPLAFLTVNTLDNTCRGFCSTLEMAPEFKCLVIWDCNAERFRGLRGLETTEVGS